MQSSGITRFGTSVTRRGTLAVERFWQHNGSRAFVTTPAERVVNARKQLAKKQKRAR
ncbi:hypothetical protein HGRIS_001023 [Hohenbuehelia grisea]|uniref:Uncharacterized protein n=1 Tax=Hohenbuehelia grisea TaxID=104357 RepID=A0ABR3IP65_9AGAR